MPLHLQHLILDSLKKHHGSPAFCINSEMYSYGQLEQSISKIRQSLREMSSIGDKHIGLMLSDSLETYAGIFACWLEGMAYVPINPDTPVERNLNVLRQADVGILLSTVNYAGYQEYNIILSPTLPAPSEIKTKYEDYKNDDLAYIFFTSGTTGTPKGVPISFTNLLSFCDAFYALNCEISSEDRCLQMFELTFDLSVMSYLIPILQGACVYTIPKNEIKYSYIFELMEDQRLTFALMVPSMLHYLRPYFGEIECPDMKYSLFCGEALPLDITEEWAKCLPNAQVMNVYGPTEDTIFCTELAYKRSAPNKAYNGVMSIGKPMKGVQTIIIDADQKVLRKGEKGELCLAGNQLTTGYWKDPEKNQESFFELDYEGSLTRFYKTGDLCFKDEDGDIMYSGRVDFQAKIQGFRVELSEVELYAKNVLLKTNTVAIAFENGVGTTEIGLVIEGHPIPTEALLAYMKSKMPAYMIPTKLIFAAKFPLNPNGKIDRKQLTNLFKSEQHATHK